MNTICILNPAAAQLFSEASPEDCAAYILWDDLPTTEHIEVMRGPDPRRIAVADLPKEDRKEILHDDLKAWADGLGHTITDIIDYR